MKFDEVSGSYIRNDRTARASCFPGLFIRDVRHGPAACLVVL